MKTDDFVRFLATGVSAVPQHAARHRIRQALLVGMPVSLAIVGAGYGLRADLGLAMAWPMFWAKLLFPLCIAASAYATLLRLARPGVEVRRTWTGMLATVLLLWVAAVVAWIGMPVPERMPALLGQSWRTCSLSIALVSLPVFAATLLALRHLAPIRQTLAGATAGALAGGVGAAIYALHCVELTLPFLAVWYVIGMLVPVLAGAALGRWLLRW